MRQKKRRIIENAKKNEKGQSLMELAISMVILLILLAGVVDVSRMILIRFLVQDAVEEGIVYGTSFPTDCNQMNDRIRANVPSGIVDDNFHVEPYIETDYGYQSCFAIFCGESQCTNPYEQVHAGRKIEITVTYGYKIATPFLGAILGSQTIPFSVSSNGVILRPPDPGT